MPPPAQPTARLAAGSAPVADPVCPLGLSAIAQDGVCNTAGLNRRISRKVFLLMFVEKYPEKFAGKYRQRYPELCAQLRRHVYLQLNSGLCLDLSSKLYMELNRVKFEKSFPKKYQKPFAMLFG